MSFNIHTRSKSPVLSIQTQPEQEQTLAAAIQAAYTQQRLVKECKSKSLRNAVAVPSPDPYSAQRRCACCSCVQHKLSVERSQDLTIHQTPIRSRNTLGGSLKGELTSAKNFLKDKSKQQLQRIRTHTVRKRSRKSRDGYRSHLDHNTHTTEVSLVPPARAYTAISECGQSMLTDFEHAPAELSGSEPHIVHQLSERPKSPERSADSRMSVPPPYDDERKSPTVVSDIDGSELQIESLQSRSFSCNDCHQQLRGKDYYDFCPQCPPGSRVLCIICAAGGGCSQHRLENSTQSSCLSPKRSPAPLYNDDDSHGTDRLYSSNHGVEHDSRYGSVLPCTRQTKVFEAETTTFRPSTIPSPENGRAATWPQSYSDIAYDQTLKPTSSNQGNFTRTPQLKASMCHSNNSPQHQLWNNIEQSLSKQQAVSETMEKPETYLREKEMALREHQAAIRERNIADKEHELLLKQRESLTRERDVWLIHSLQRIVAFQELSRGHHIGAQFSPSKENSEHLHCSHISRSESSSSVASEISLLHDDQKQSVKSSLSQAVADVEAMIGHVTTDKGHIRTHAPKRKKGQTSDAAQPATSMKQEKAVTMQPFRFNDKHSIDEDDDDDGDEGLTPPKKQKQESIDLLNPQKIFACPYCKHDRPRYSPLNLREKNYRGCSGHYLPDIPRLKQHLRRVHWRPENHCPRCFEVYRTPAELNEHLTSKLGCAVKECPFPEKMDTNQRQQIHVKRPKTPPETLWYDIYKILFPNSTLPDSPYAENEDVLTPPSSAVTSTATHDEAAQMLNKILIDRLNKRTQIDSYLRDLISQELIESMSELFSRISITHEASPRVLSSTLSSAPPSIVISPTPSSTERSSSAIQSHAPQTFPCSSDHEAEVIIPRLELQKTPQLHEPKRHLGPSLKPPLPISAWDMKLHGIALDGRGQIPMTQVSMSDQDEINPRPPVTRCPDAHHVTSSSVQSSSDRRTAQNVAATLPVFDLQPPVHVREDKGYDDESYSYERGDDYHAMSDAVWTVSDQSSSRNPGDLFPPAWTKPLKPPGPSRNFVPVRLQALEDLSPDQASRSQLFKTDKSVGSLIDSGYGSGNSDRFVAGSSDSSYNNADEEMPDLENSPVGHASFDEQYEIWEVAQIQSINPWPTEADIGKAL